MTEFSSRVSDLIKSLGIKKTAFAERLNVSQAFVSQLCSGAARASDRTISDICREFNVSETWLRTGDGEMFLQLSRQEELAAFFGDLLREAPDFRHRLISVLSRLSVEEWAMLEEMADRLAEEAKKEDQA